MLAGSSIADEGRTLHLGIDIFCRDLETVYSPCDGEIVQTGREPQGHSFGHYIIIKPTGVDYYIFFGHMSADQPHLGPVSAGDTLGSLGDFTNGENGDWSRHLHIQLFRDLPSDANNLIGYSTAKNFSENQLRYPNPSQLFPQLESQE
jgi:murein DD-endopeptidase MepM/ murein hydrolase activator NlpD